MEPPIFFKNSIGSIFDLKMKALANNPARISAMNSAPKSDLNTFVLRVEMCMFQLQENLAYIRKIQKDYGHLDLVREQSLIEHVRCLDSSLSQIYETRLLISHVDLQAT